MEYEQVGIEGIAQNKPLNPYQQREGVIRPKLLRYITLKLRTDQSGFARMISVSPATVTQWLYTERMPAGAALIRMASEFGLSYNELLDLFETQQPAQSTS